MQALGWEKKGHRELEWALTLRSSRLGKRDGQHRSKLIQELQGFGTLRSGRARLGERENGFDLEG